MNWELVLERKNRGEQNLKNKKYFSKSMWHEERNKVREIRKQTTIKKHKEMQNAPGEL